MIARVIVDVPSRATDRPFDYAIPDDMAGWVEVGSRVGVPFGGRVLQGFVMAIVPFAEVDGKKLKPIAELLDHLPPLSPDLVELAQWISDKYCCALTTALQAMIPSALKGKADSVVTLAEDADAREGGLIEVTDEPWLHYVRQSGGEVRLAMLQERFPGAAASIKAAIQRGTLEERVSIRDRLAVRKVFGVSAGGYGRSRGIDCGVIVQGGEAAIRGAEEKGWVSIRETVPGRTRSVRRTRLPTDGTAQPDGGAAGRVRRTRGGARQRSVAGIPASWRYGKRQDGGLSAGHQTPACGMNAKRSCWCRRSP